MDGRPRVLVALDRHTDATISLKEAEAVPIEHGDAGKFPEWHEEAVQYLHLPARRAPPSAALSDAKGKVLRLLASDLSLREIGRELYLSTNTVKTHVHSVYRKLGVWSRTDAIRAARTRGRHGTPIHPGKRPTRSSPLTRSRPTGSLWTAFSCAPALAQPYPEDDDDDHQRMSSGQGPSRQ